MKNARALGSRHPFKPELAACRRRRTCSWIHRAAWLLSAALLTLPAWADSEPLIRLESAPGHSGQTLPLAHPATMTSESLSVLLGGLEFRESGLLGRASRQPVFSAEEITALAPLLAEALGRAGRSEQVRFATFARRSGALSQLLKTEAVTFVATDGELNLAFAGIHEFAGPDVDFFDFLALTDRDPLTLERSLLRIEPTLSGWSVHSARPLWVKSEPGSPTVDARGPEAPGESLATESADAEPAGPAKAPPPAIAPGSGTNSTLEAEVRQRLEFLKGLYEDGLISQDEYEQQRREALRRLD